MRFLLNWLCTSIAIAIAAYVVPGIEPFGASEAWVSFAFVGLFLGLVNALVKPLLSLISLPLTCLTLGMFQLVINSAMLELASWLSANLLGGGILINGFGPAFMAAIVISVICALLNSLTAE